MPEKKSWVIHSTSQPGVVYSVTQDVFDDFSCTCPDFTFRGHQCKHIKRVKMRLVGKKQKNKLLGVENTK